MRSILDSNPKRYVEVLAAVYGLSTYLDLASAWSLGDAYSTGKLIRYALTFGMVGGIAWLYLYSFLLRWTGRWIGGTAEPEHVRAAFAWSSVPHVLLLLLWIPSFVFFGVELFKSDAPSMDANLGIAFAFSGIGLVISVWGMLIFLKCLGEAQGFSAWKALLNALLADLVVVVPIGAIVAVLSM